MLFPQKYLDRLTPLRHHPIQQQILNDTYPIRYRFNIVPSGRRSGKTEIVGKRRFVARVVRGVAAPNPRYFVSAPTRDQVKRLYWHDLKILTLPFQNPNRRPSESHLIIYLKGDREIHLLGMDKPERIEGSHWDGGILDEVANMKKQTWPEHVRPALSTPGRPPAWCDFVGCPEGRNHYYELAQFAKAEYLEKGVNSDWVYYHWKSADILSAEEIAAARAELDSLTFQQEYEGDFLNFSGRAYYNFVDTDHCAKLSYDPKQPIQFCFDFNYAPGVAVIMQEQPYVDPRTHESDETRVVSGIIDEVYIPRNSNTTKVCQKLVDEYSNHQGYIYIYGDSTGGNPGSAKVMGSDWDLVRQVLGPTFTNRLMWKVPRSNPRERARVNAVNSRLLSTDGTVRMQIHPKKCPHTVKDFEGVSILEGTNEIDKKSNLELSHLSDAVGYHIYKEYPVKPRIETVQSISGF